MRLCITLLATFSIAAHCAAQKVETVGSARIELQNGKVRRTLEKNANVWRTVSFSRADGADEVKIESDVFLLRLMDGTQLTAEDYRAAGRPMIDSVGSTASVSIYYVAGRELPDEAPESLTVTYELADEPYLRKSMTLAMDKEDAIDVLQVERLTVNENCERGGRGEPIFIGDSWFCGLEYPGSRTHHSDGLITLTHFPGLAEASGGTDGDDAIIASKSAVIGTGGADDPLKLAFMDYLDTIRRPPRNFLQYNSWYDLRGDDLTIENLIEACEEFNANLLEPYGLKMDAFVPDDGWQAEDAIWRPRRNLYSEGFEPLAEALQARGTRMGLWMPLNGTNLNVDWGAQRGYERSNRGDFYCLAGEKYNAAIRQATERNIRQGNLVYYKHDFNTLRCSAEGHGHLADDRHGHEANLDAELQLLAYERQLQPDIFLNVTSSVWLSPWWLMHADTIWVGGPGDFGYNKRYPQLSPREWAMTFRDAYLHKVYKRWRHLVPISGLMTHGIIKGRLCRGGRQQQTLREWSDYVVMYYGRGVQLKELYISPELLSDEQWEVLGRATRWAVGNCKLLENSVFVGGDPEQGDVYGYAHWRGERGIICLRNPAPFSQPIRVPFDKTVGYRGNAGRVFEARVIYPYIGPYCLKFGSGWPVELEIPPCSVMMFELRSGVADGQPVEPPVPISANCDVEKRQGDIAVIKARMKVPDEPMRRCDLYLLSESNASPVAFRDIKMNGEPTEARRASGAGWLLDVVDVTGQAEGDISVTARVRYGSNKPFSGPGAKLSVYVIADRPVDAAAPEDENLPLPIAEGYRRVSDCLLERVKLKQENHSIDISAGDLKAMTAAKLRLRVFGANPEARYRDKFIYLNGEKIGRVPANAGRLDAWQEHIIDLNERRMELVQMSNTVELTNAGGDCYKFTGVALSVQLADERWVQTSADWTVHCSRSGWLHADGETFDGGRSGAITLKFP